MNTTNKKKVKKKSLKYLIISGSHHVTMGIKLGGFEQYFTLCKSSATGKPLLILYSLSDNPKKLSKIEMETFKKNFTDENSFLLKHFKG